MNIALVTLNNMTADNLQRALNNLTSVKKQGYVTVTKVLNEHNATFYRVTFFFNDPERTQMMLNNSLTSNTTAVKITRLQKGKVTRVVRVLAGVGDLDDQWILSVFTC